MKDIRLFLTDVDGCLTDGGMYYSANGDELKRFCVYDGMGMVLLSQQGIRCGILTSETTDIVRNRARKLNLDYLYMGVGRRKDLTPVLRFAPALAEPVALPYMSKLDACLAICDELGISLQQVCYVGDDVNDIDILSKVGLPACPANALPEIQAIPDILHLQHKGGDGAIRELCEMILHNNNIL
ncbi:MAG: HAD hydrolase family protein [Paludibacteraceae bacterium]|nr:HAD hydrolase family protein [Paludibacteraceae bacterium]